MTHSPPSDVGKVSKVIEHVYLQLKKNHCITPGFRDISPIIRLAIGPSICRKPMPIHPRPFHGKISAQWFSSAKEISSFANRRFCRVPMNHGRLTRPTSRSQIGHRFARRLLLLRKSAWVSNRRASPVDLSPMGIRVNSTDP